MTISQGNYTNKITLYPLSKPSTNLDPPIWIGNEDSDEENGLQILTLDQMVLYKEETEDEIINKLS
jgi:hypothetical protein